MSLTRAQLESWLDDACEGIEGGILLADGYDDAFIGIGERFHELTDGGVERVPVAMYDIDKCIDCLMQDGMTRDEAEEYFDFNTLSAYVGIQTPIYVRVMSRDSAKSPVFHAEA